MCHTPSHRLEGMVCEVLELEPCRGGLKLLGRFFGRISSDEEVCLLRSGGSRQGTYSARRRATAASMAKRGNGVPVAQVSRFVDGEMRWPRAPTLRHSYSSVQIQQCSVPSVLSRLTAAGECDNELTILITRQFTERAPSFVPVCGVGRVRPREASHETNLSSSGARSGEHTNNWGQGVLPSYGTEGEGEL